MNIFAVSGNSVSRIMLRSALGEEANVVLFDSAERCLDEMTGMLPDLVLSADDLPGMSAHDFCHQLKTTVGFQDIPVILLSADNSLGARLKGHELGVDDYIVTPYAIEELRHRIKVLRRQLEKKELVTNIASDAEALSSALLSSIDEYATLIKFMRTLNGAMDNGDISRSVHQLLAGYHLNGTLLISVGDSEMVSSSEGIDLPKDFSVMRHLRRLERIFEFQHRCVFNFAYTALLIQNMPTGDPELCGRLRDHLAIALESADKKVEALHVFRQHAHVQGNLREVLVDMRKTINTYVSQQNAIRYQGSKTLGDLLQQLNASFTSLGLSESLEEELHEMIQAAAYKLLALSDNPENSTQALEELEQRLQHLLQPAARNPEALPSGPEEQISPAANPSSVEIW